MNPAPAIGAALLAAALGYIAQRTARTSRRLRRYTAPPPPEWVGILDRTCPLAAGLSRDERSRLQGLMQLFLAEKRFEGCGGMRITKEVETAIAAQACLLLVGRPGLDVYPRLRSILVYPDTYRDGPKGFFHGDEEEDVRIGESWDSGVVVLSWRDAAGGRRHRDEPQVVYHEFAHQLDQENGALDGMPRIDDAAKAAAWTEAMTKEYEALRAKAEQGRPTVIDPYGATHPSEFFAVTTESFFGQPRRLKIWHPELYAQLREYYGVDPCGWTDGQPIA